MEKLTLCSKVLYDIDMVDKVNKIVQLETDLNGLPPMLFNSYSEFEIKKKIFLKESNQKIEKWANQIAKQSFTNKDFIIRGLQTCNYNHYWHKLTITHQFDKIKLELIKLLHEFYDINWNTTKISWLSNMIDSIFIGIIGGFYVFTQLDIEFENIFTDIIYTNFEKQIYLQLFLREDLFHLKCNNCGETAQINIDNMCFNCNFIKTF